MSAHKDHVSANFKSTEWDRYGLNCVSPPNSYVEFLIPSTTEYDFIWNRVFTEVIKLKQGSSHGPNPICPYKKGTFGGRHTGRLLNEAGGRDQSDASISHEKSKVASKAPEARGEAWGILPQSLQKEPTLLMPWSQTSRFQNCKTIIFCCLSHPVYGTCYGSSSKLMQGFFFFKFWFFSSLNSFIII